MGTIMNGSLRIGKTEVGIKLKSVARGLKQSKAKTSYCSPCCNAKVGRKNYCKECGQELSRSDIDRRFFDTGSEKVILKKSEIDSLKSRANDKTFEVEGFIREGAIPQIYAKKSYFVVPSSDTEKEKLKLIAKGLLLTGRAMVGKYVYRNTEKLAIISTSMGGLVLHNLFWSQARYDIPENFKLLESDIVPDEEVPAQIKSLVEAMSGNFVHSDYTSDYYENFKELVLKAKDRGIEEIETEEVVSAEAKTEEDFLNALSEEAKTQTAVQNAE